MVLETFTVTDSRVHPIKVRKDDPIKWSMVVAGEMTVELSVYFRATSTGGKPVEVPVVNVLHCETASHEWTCPDDGELVFLFDNSFSWFNDKEIMLDFTSGEAAAAQGTAPLPATPAAAVPVAPADTTPTGAQPTAASSTNPPVRAQQSGTEQPAEAEGAAVAAEVTEPADELARFLNLCREVAPKVAEVERSVPEGDGCQKVRDSLAEARRILCEYAALQEAAAQEAAKSTEGEDGCTIS